MASLDLSILKNLDISEVSDGYHTFNELYHHRALLFASLVNMDPENAWKSTQHEDGTMFDGMFIVGIQTDVGHATYHYDMKYWNMFHCKEIDKAPPFDGHTPDQAITRIFCHFVLKRHDMENNIKETK